MEFHDMIVAILMCALHLYYFSNNQQLSSTVEYIDELLVSCPSPLVTSLPLLTRSQAIIYFPLFMNEHTG